MADRTNWKTYTFPHCPVTFSYPGETEGWKLEATQSAFLCVLLRLDQGQAGPNIAFMVSHLSTPTDLEQFTSKKLEQVPQDYELKDTTLCNLPSKKLEFQIRKPPYPKFWQIWTVKDNFLAFSLLYTSDKDSYTKYQPTVVDILQSLKIGDAQLISYIMKPISLGPYSLKVPNFWENNNTSNKSIAALHFQGTQTLANGTVKPTITRLTYSYKQITPNKTLDDYLADIYQQLEMMLVDKKNLQEDKITLEQIEFKRLRFKSDALLKGNKYTQLIALKDNHIINITLESNSPSSVIDPISDRILKTFTSNPAEADYHAFEDTHNKFGIKFDNSTWTPAEKELEPITLTLMAVDDVTQSTGLMVMIHNDPGSPETFYKNVKSQNAEFQMQNVKEEKYEINGMPAFLIKSDLLAPNLQAKMFQVLLVKDDLGFVFNFMAPKATYLQRWSQTESFLKTLYFF
eukprot:TRINITY_DN633_c0_g1_i1.p1 TRINITY_DN633_c0_g1~~TRINITY_DN633_c0_g1_i1.p1  ORF type:complete len:477 (-),score=91.30 TRINITY_DN633_c0_g1_i1:27-1400(-)